MKLLFVWSSSIFCWLRISFITHTVDYYHGDGNEEEEDVEQEGEDRGGYDGDTGETAEDFIKSDYNNVKYAAATTTTAASTTPTPRSSY